jgi:hypothetical protein
VLSGRDTIPSKVRRERAVLPTASPPWWPAWAPASAGPAGARSSSTVAVTALDVAFYSFCLRRAAEVGVQVRETDCRTFHSPESVHCVSENVELYDDKGSELDSAGSAALHDVLAEVSPSCQRGSAWVNGQSSSPSW